MPATLSNFKFPSSFHQVSIKFPPSFHQVSIKFPSNIKFPTNRKIQFSGGNRPSAWWIFQYVQENHCTDHHTTCRERLSSAKMINWPNSRQISSFHQVSIKFPSNSKFPANRKIRFSEKNRPSAWSNYFFHFRKPLYRLPHHLSRGFERCRCPLLKCTTYPGQGCNPLRHATGSPPDVRNLRLTESGQWDLLAICQKLFSNHTESRSLWVMRWVVTAAPLTKAARTKTLPRNITSDFVTTTEQ